MIKVRMNKVLGLILLSLTCMISCTKKTTVNDLYKFPSTKDVLVLVNIDFTADANTNGGIDLTGKSFILNAFAVDAGNRQVAIGLVTGTPVADLPVTLTGSHTSFDAILRLPIEVQPGPKGYALHFELKQPTTALVLTTPDAKLDALRGEIKAGTAAATNNVDLSIASSLAYRFLSGAVDQLSTTPSLGSYAELVALFKAKQLSIESGVDSSASHDINSYVTAILSGINYQVLTDSNFQKTLAEKLLLAVDTESSADKKATASEKLAESFTANLIALATEVRDNLADASSTTSKVFTVNFIDVTSLPEPESYANAVFAPLALAFTDEDSSPLLKGDVNVTGPIVQNGVASYNVYFGGETKSEGKLKLIGNILASLSPLAITLPMGTEQPVGATRFWVYPVASGKELNIPASLGIINLGGTNNAPPAPLSLAATNSGSTNTVTWSSVTGAETYNLYWSTSTPVRSTSNRIKAVSSPFLHKSLLTGATYYYSITSVKGGIESVLSDPASAAVTTTPTTIVPLALSYPVPQLRFVRGIANTSTPTVTAPATGRTFTISGTLPPGIGINAQTGVISGTTKVFFDPRTYTVTLTTPTGTTTADIKIDAYNTLFWSAQNLTAITANPSTVYVGGAFSQVVPLTGSGALFDPTTFKRPDAIGWPYFEGGDVFTAIADPSETGAFYVGGSFTRVAGEVKIGVARIKPNGEVDTNFTVDMGYPEYCKVYSLAIIGSDLYIGGDSIATTFNSTNLLAVDKTTGADDTTFVSPISGSVNALQVSSNRLFVGGNFTATGSSAQNFIALASSNGTVDATLSAGTSGSVKSLLLIGNTIYIAGNFTTLGGASRSNVGAMDTASGVIATGFAPILNGTINVLASDGNVIYLGGNFTLINSVTHVRLGAVNLDGTNFSGFSPGAVDQDINALLLDGNTLYMGGQFKTIGTVGRLNFASLNKLTGVVGTSDPKVNGTVNTVTFIGSNLFLGGDFTGSGGVMRSCLAALDTATGEPKTFDGSVECEFIASLALDGNNLYASGFTDFTLNSHHYEYLMKMDATSGAFDPAFNPQSDSVVGKIAAANGKVFATGYFTTIGGQTINNFAALDGATGTSLNYSIEADNTVNALQLSPDNSKLYIAGDFTQLGGSSHQHLAELTTAPGAFTSFGYAFSSNPLVNSLAIDDNFIYVGGKFSQIGGIAKTGIAQIERASGNAITALNIAIPGGNSRVYYIGLGQESIYLGGNFTSLGGSTRADYGAVNATTGLATSFEPLPNEVMKGSVRVGTANYVINGKKIELRN